MADGNTAQASVDKGTLQVKKKKLIWEGQTVCCVASGPSLTKEDCELVASKSVKIIAVNNSWQMFSKCDVIYAGDRAWWVKNHKKITIEAELWTCSRPAARDQKVNLHNAYGGYNSGLRAIQFAQSRGARRTILIGYDCRIVSGKTHWHGNHEDLNNPDVRRCKLWNIQFTRLSKQLGGMEVINATRSTALSCFKKVELEKVEWH